MRTRLIAAFLVLDGLCAVALPLALPMLGLGAGGDRYVEVAGACVEAAPTDGADLGGRVVPMAHCR